MHKKMYSEVNGKGKNVVLIHGWGMHGGLWGEFNALLTGDFQTHTIDLPGFGFSKNIKSEYTLDALTEVVEEYVENLNSPVYVVGWSLGGLLALNILKRKNVAINKVVLIATTPSFTKREDWVDGVEQSVFDAFSKDLQNDYKKTLKRFLSLQTRGSDLGREELRELNKKLNERGEPDFKALENGLTILSSTDLRNKQNNEIPAMVILGGKDTLVPVAVKNEFKKCFPVNEIIILEKAGHTPFISNPQICAEKIKKFINE